MFNVKNMRRHIWDAIHLVKANIDQNPLDFDLDRITDPENKQQLHIGRNRLQKGFKQLFGSSLKSYEKKKRLEAALPMLEEGRLTLAQIAKKCGYASQSSFTRAFKEVFNMTPAAYQSIIINQ